MTKYRGPQAPNLSFYDRFCPKLVVPTGIWNSPYLANVPQKMAGHQCLQLKAYLSVMKPEQRAGAEELEFLHIGAHEVGIYKSKK